MVLSKKKKQEIERKEIGEKYEKLLKEVDMNTGKALYIASFCFNNKEQIRKFLEEKLKKFDPNDEPNDEQKYKKLKETFDIITGLPQIKNTKLVIEAISKKIMELTKL
jgi:hypothetical protein